MKTFDKKTVALTLIIAALAICLAFALLSSGQNDQTVISAVAQNKIENLESDIADLQSENKGYKSIQDSLIQRNKELSILIEAKEAKYAVIALNYVKEKNRVKELSGDSAVGLFLDRADCTEYPIVKYDEDYIIPIDPIRYYNILAVDFDESLAVNQNLRDENSIRILQIKTLNQLIDTKDNETQTLNRIIVAKNGIIAMQNTRIEATQNKLRKQKAKTYFVGAAGVVILIGTLIF